MGIEKVIFYSTSDREDQKGIVKKYTMVGKHLSFIIHGEMGWGDFYRYMVSVAEVEEVKSVPK